MAGGRHLEKSKNKNGHITATVSLMARNVTGDAN